MHAPRLRQAWLGAALIAFGTALLAVPVLFPAWANWQQARLTRAPAPWRNLRQVSHVVPTPGTLSTSPASGAEPAPGQVAAYLRIPKLDLAAAVLQGSSEALLAAAPGHEPQSVMPGAPGTAVVVAHNLTFFRHLDLLRPGDTVVAGTARGVFRFEVRRSLVVPAGAALPNTPWPSLDLVACYPLNALYYTSERYVVEATLVAAARPTDSLAGLRATPPQFAVTLPASLAALPLWLSDTSYLVGDATFRGGPSLRLTASGASWSLVAQSIRMFAASVRALAKASPRPLTGFGPAPVLQGLTGTGPWIVAPTAPLDISVQLDAAGRPLAVTVTTPTARIATHSRVTPAPYAVTLQVHGGVLYLSRAGTL